MNRLRLEALLAEYREAVAMSASADALKKAIEEQSAYWQQRIFQMVKAADALASLAGCRWDRHEGRVTE